MLIGLFSFLLILVFLVLYTSLVSIWFPTFCFYEIIILDPTDFVYNVLWRQGSFVLQFMARLGISS